MVHAITLFAALLTSFQVPPASPPPPPTPVPVPSMFMGEIAAGGGSLFVFFTVESTPAGSPRVVVTMPAAGAMAQAAESVGIDGDRLTFTVASQGVRGRFEGRVTEGRYAGELRLSAPNQPEARAKFDLPESVLAPEVEGAVAYRGRLEVGGGGIEMVVVLARDADKGPVASIDIPMQGIDGWPLVVEGVEAGTWRLLLPVGLAAPSFELSEIDDASRLEGVLRQGGAELPLAMARLERYEHGRLSRPQHPQPPFPYTARDVEWRHPHGHRLAGTLTLPAAASAEQPVPGVVLVSGSGAQDRDETIFGHKPFLVLADALTRGGIAVLRYDDRGVGGSGGDFGLADTFDFASDADAATEFLKELPEIDASNVGILGHSEGGLVAPIVAKWQREQGKPETMLAFAVLLAGPGVPGDAILQVQMRRLLEAGGATEEELVPVLESQSRLLAAAKAGDLAEMQNSARDLVVSQAALNLGAELDNEVLLESAAGAVAEMQSKWMQTFLKLDPAPLLAEMGIPTLAVIGSLDRQVDPEQNLPRIEAALRQGGAPFEVRRLEGLNHLFQPATTGGIDEYGAIETTIDPAAIALIVDWVRRTTGVAANAAAVDRAP